MNIEKTISEHAVSDILTPMLESQDRIVTEDVAQLFDQATGLDTPTASGTVTTTIEESRNLISAIIRKAWTATLTMLGGASVISYIAAAYTYLRTRLQGNETYGIPDRRSEISASSPLAANLALLNDRKISNGDNTPDGISLAQSVLSTNNPITELVDDNEEWDMKAVWLSEMFPNLTRLILNCRSIVIPTDTSKTWLTGTYPQGVTIYAKTITGGYYHERLMSITAAYLNMPEFETTNQCRIGGTIGEINMPKFRRVLSYWAYQDFIDAAGVETIHLPAMDYLNSCYHYDTAMIRCADLKHLIAENWDGSYANSNGCDVLAKSCPELLDIDLSGCKKHKWHTAVNCPKLEYVKFGTMTEFVRGATGGGNTNVEWDGCVNLIKIEFGEGTACSIDLGTWSPTLDSSNLQQFLENFRDVLFTRLAQRTSTTSLTLTLSPAVYKVVYGLDADYNVDPNALAQTASLADFGITTEDLNEIEIAAGITTATKYATWLDTYRGAIYWNIGHS